MTHLEILLHSAVTSHISV